MKLLVKKGATSRRLAVFIADSSSTTGAGLTGLTSGSAGLTWYYWREDQGNVGATQVTLAAGTRGTFASGGFVEKDATNMPGWYELGVPDAVLATGAKWAAMHLKGATNMAPLPIEIQLVDFDPDDAAGLGLSRLDAAVTTRLAPTVAARTLDVSATGEAGVDWANIGAPTTAQALSGTTIATSQIVASVSGAVGSVTAAVTAGTVTDKTGYALSAAGVDAVLDEVVEGTTTFRELLRGFAAALLAKASGLATTTATYRDLADLKARITATVDADGNRTAVTLDLT